MSERTVVILAVCRKLTLLPATLMVFKTLRIGFPTARVIVDIETDLPTAKRAIEASCADVGAEFCYREPGGFSHPTWIQQTLLSLPGEVVFLDTDMVFWKNCEGFKFEHPFAGYFCPQFADPFSKAITMPRLHTSFLWVNTAGLLERLEKVPTPSFLTPHEFFRPFIYYHGGVRYFQDTTGALFQAIGGEPFKAEHLECYDHLNCGTLADVVEAGHPLGKEFAARREAIFKDMEIIRNSWPMYERYYGERKVRIR